MALINCPECKKEISDKASLCPQCGYQLFDKNENKTTVQLTSKELKKQQIFAFIPLFIGIIIFFTGNYNLGLIFFLIGAIWSFIIGIKIWWEHK
jgi:uncharacterized membrane protein YvbJ